jgi:hypothetical protein
MKRLRRVDRIEKDGFSHQLLDGCLVFRATTGKAHVMFGSFVLEGNFNPHARKGGEK